MRAIPFTAAIRSDRTLLAALSFVVLFGAVQIGAIAFHYLAEARAGYRFTPSSVTTIPSQATGPVNPKTGAVEAVSAPAAATHPASPSSATNRLLEQARKLRERGDTNNALARLQEALLLEPRNANVLAEMAMIYESIQLFDRSNETWRRVQDIGPAAGALYELADLKLKTGVSPAATPSRDGTSPVFTMNGIPDGSNFGITELTSTQANDPDAEMHMTLRVAVKARPNAPIDYTKVKIQVFFYDVVDNDRVLLTDADVSYEWLTPHHNWTDANPEVLAVTYLRPKKDAALSSDAALTAAAAAVVPPAPGRKGRPSKAVPPADGADAGQRKYLGYIVRVYYRDQLQAVRAEPNRLLNLFPPPFTAPTQ